MESGEGVGREDQKSGGPKENGGRGGQGSKKSGGQKNKK